MSRWIDKQARSRHGLGLHYLDIAGSISFFISISISISISFSISIVADSVVLDVGFLDITIAFFIRVEWTQLHAISFFIVVVCVTFNNFATNGASLS